MYPTSGNVEATIDQLQKSPLTSPILSLLNQSASNPSVLVYNDGGNQVFDTSGNYIGDPSWGKYINQLKSGGNINEVYLSFSTNGCEYMDNLISKDRGAAANILTYIKDNLGFNGIDLDYEGSDFTESSPIYSIAKLATEVGLPLTAAPYQYKSNWQSCVNYVLSIGGEISWLNLQCYAGGKSNNPGDWLDIGAPIIPGSCNSCGGPQTTCSPEDMEKLFRLWRTGEGDVSLSCWTGIPNRSPENIAGGFIWVYSSIQNDFDAYMDAVAVGLGM